MNIIAIVTLNFSGVGVVILVVTTFIAFILLYNGTRLFKPLLYDKESDSLKPLTAQDRETIYWVIGEAVYANDMRNLREYFNRHSLCLIANPLYTTIAITEFLIGMSWIGSAVATFGGFALLKWVVTNKSFAAVYVFCFADHNVVNLLSLAKVFGCLFALQVIFGFLMCVIGHFWQRIPVGIMLIRYFNLFWHPDLYNVLEKIGAVQYAHLHDNHKFTFYPLPLLKEAKATACETAQNAKAIRMALSKLAKK